MTDTLTQRKNMVDTQILPSDITDRRIPRAMLDIPRELFVPEALKATAYRDGAVKFTMPRTEGETGPGTGQPTGPCIMLPPQVLAKLIQLMEVEATSSVLVIGGGMGYGAAILARLAKSVHLLEADAAMAAAATSALAAAAAGTVEVHQGLLVAGAPDQAPFDAILIEGGVETVPPALLDQLKDQGRMVAVHMTARGGRAAIWQRFGGTFDMTHGFDTVAPLPTGFARARDFVF